MSTENKKREGYWTSGFHPEYPQPIPNVLTEEQSLQIYNKIVELENMCRSRISPDYNIKRYLGMSTSRFTGERLSNAEYSTPEWQWPDGFAKHYVLEHRVKPSDEFLKYLGITLKD